MVSCSDSDSKDPSVPYDPSKPVKLETFYPDSGKFLQKIILKGENFGNKPEDIKVYFNSKRAAVVGTTGKSMYVLAPRLPGDLCTISVVVGKDSLVYPEIFNYTTSVSVTTIAGNGNSSQIKEGTLGYSQVQARYLCVDAADNLFAINRLYGV